MTIFKTGDMWDSFGEVDLFCITINGMFKADGELIPDNVEVWEYNETKY